MPSIARSSPNEETRKSTMPSIAARARARARTNPHPYLHGNFAPLQQTLPLTPCAYTGAIPPSLHNGQYVRNGSNPLTNADPTRDAHWFDGDGMLAGVLFRRTPAGVAPAFVNQFVLTDVFLSARASPRLRIPILPSIATLVDPLARVLRVACAILRTLLLILLSHLPGSPHKITKISVANTSVIYHDGRALALCESGPPMRIQLPGLESVGWFDGARAENEPPPPSPQPTLGQNAGLLTFMRQWTTAHPKLDPRTHELLLFHSSFAPPYVQYSILPAAGSRLPKLLNAPVPGIASAKMMHDFGCSARHTVILDLPLSLDPLNQLRARPPVAYDATSPARFGVFPRRAPAAVRWFETAACCIFHTAATWDELDAQGNVSAVHLLACRLTSATPVFAAGNLDPPVVKTADAQRTREKRRMPFSSRLRSPRSSEEDPLLPHAHSEEDPLLPHPHSEEDPLLPHAHSEETPLLPSPAPDPPTSSPSSPPHLYHYTFSLATGTITTQHALSALPFEFPSTAADASMRAPRFVYGCSTTAACFAPLGKAAKIDAIVKFHVAELMARGTANPPEAVTGVVDARGIAHVLARHDPDDPVQVFPMPRGWFAQEPRFVACDTSAGAAEDAGHLLFYAFDESQLDPLTGAAPPDDDPIARARSELWILCATDMRTLVARVMLPLRVPYGLHGAWFPRGEVEGQRAVRGLRGEGAPAGGGEEGEGGWEKGGWGGKGPVDGAARAGGEGVGVIYGMYGMYVRCMILGGFLAIARLLGGFIICMPPQPAPGSRSFSSGSR